MQFTATAALALPLMAAAVAIPGIPIPILSRDQQVIKPNSSVLCFEKSRKTCPQSSDGVQRCLGMFDFDLCVIDCGSQTVCRTQCNNQGFVNGFCTVGAIPCICTDLSAADSRDKTPPPKA